nr:HD domain-containing phosphohydrolase [uncultured Sphaerochaeta sp.]
MSKKRLELRPNVFIVVVALLFVLLGTFYLRARWIEYKGEAEKQAKIQASSIAATLNGERLVTLFDQNEIPSAAEFERFHTRLLRAARVNSQMHYIVFYIEQKDGISVLVDSRQHHDGSSLSYPDLNAEFNPVFHEALDTKSTLLSSVVEGGAAYTLILSPMLNLETDEVFGGLAFAMDTDELYQSARINIIRQFLILFATWLFMIASSILFSQYLKSLKMRKALEKTNHQLLETDKEMKLLVDQMPQALGLHEIVCNEQGKPIDYVFLKVNPVFTQFTGLTEAQLVGKRILEAIPQTEHFWIEEYGEVAINGRPKVIERYAKNFDKWFLVHVYSPKKGQFITIFEDISERRERERELEFLNYHDTYTKMFNRNAFVLQFSEYDTRRMYPLAVLLFDINGLKVVNDTYGFEIGDLLIWQLAESIREACSDNAWVSARLGGDEFGILVPYAIPAAIESLLSQIQENYNRRNVGNRYSNISFGYAMKEEQGIGFETVLKEAEDDLFQHKLVEHTTSRQQTIEVLLQTLFSKSSREKEHSSRVSALCMLIAKELGFSDEKIELIKVAGIMHDIGKIAIDDSVLNKEGKLDQNEWAQMKRHPEIGFHLLSSVSRYAEFAKDILAHHERWDGKGYPRGLQQEAIPFTARIISVADAYDAMTYHRPYRDPITHQQAMEELARCSGSQFDPRVVEAFFSISTETVTAP